MDTAGKTSAAEILWGFSQDIFLQFRFCADFFYINVIDILATTVRPIKLGPLSAVESKCRILDTN